MHISRYIYNRIENIDGHCFNKILRNRVFHKKKESEKIKANENISLIKTSIKIESNHSRKFYYYQ